MKFKTFIVWAFVVSAIFTSCKDDEIETIGNWKIKAYFNGLNRTEGTSFGIGDIGYFGLGKDADTYFTDFWKYDPNSNTWTQLSDFPGTPRAFNFSVNTESKGYMGLGYDGTNDLNDFWEYNPANDTWTKLPDFKDQRRDVVAFAIGNDIYVGTGSTNRGKVDQNDFYKYSNGQWTSIAGLSGQKRRSSVAATLSGKGYIIGGLTSSGANLDDFWSYDPASNTWTQLDKLTNEDTGNADGKIQRYNAVAFVVDSKIYIATGTTSSGAVSSVYEWNPSNKKWTEKTNLESDARQGANAFVLNNSAYIMCGNNSYYFYDLWMFEPNKEKVTDD
jgi:N-acetylneuraminic acid mutarotase